SFAYNPQFGIEISGPDPEDADGLCTVIFAVLQKNRRELKQKGLDNLAIGFAVYEVDKIYGHLDRNFFATHKSIARSAAFINLREVDKIYGHLDRNFFATHKSIARSAAFINLREVRSTISLNIFSCNASKTNSLSALCCYISFFFSVNCFSLLH
uniref:Calpain_III domain-containing protein n=1 Tax=Ascaris lumbricoides TaxID=6252 RepID=A0A0M3IWZ5_ASCLU